MAADSNSTGGPIRAAYRRAGMNRSQFQRAIGVAYSTILNWERGRTRPNADHLELISRVTGVPVHDILGGEASVGSAAPRPAAFDEFMATSAGRELSSSERRTLESIVFHDITPTVSTYHAILVGLRLGTERKGGGSRARGRRRRRARPG
jgi:transcriptional regulator with XRE-family HTH domain